MSKPLSKVKHQIKSGKYYVFWGACTLAVMAGQIYVGAGYRGMSESVRDLTEIIEIQLVLIPKSARQTSSKTNYQSSKKTS